MTIEIPSARDPIRLIGSAICRHFGFIW
jgi:hypothetical protein